MVRRAGANGFSLVEVGVVLAVIGILVGISINRMPGARANAELESLAEELGVLSRIGHQHLGRAGEVHQLNLASVGRDHPLFELLPPDFDGLNPNGVPYVLTVVDNTADGTRMSSRVTIWTCTPHGAALATRDPAAITWVPGGCGGDDRVVHEVVHFPSRSEMRLALRKHQLEDGQP